MMTAFCFLGFFKQMAEGEHERRGDKTKTKRQHNTKKKKKTKQNKQTEISL
jgi:hypothetical protein